MKKQNGKNSVFEALCSAALLTQCLEAQCKQIISINEVGIGLCIHGQIEIRRKLTGESSLTLLTAW